MMRGVRRIIPGVMEAMMAQRDLAQARQDVLPVNSPLRHGYAAEVLAFNDQIERLESQAATLAAKRQAQDEARHNPART